MASLIARGFLLRGIAVILYVIENISLFLSPGFPSPVSSSVSSPSVQPPVYVWGPTWVANKPRARLSLVGMP